MVEVTLDPERGYRPLRNENPRMGVQGVLGKGWMAYLEVTSRSRVRKARAAVWGTTPLPRSRSSSVRLSPETHNWA